MQRVVKGPARCAERCNLTPKSPVSRDELAGRDGAERCVRWRLRGPVQDFLVIGLETLKMRPFYTEQWRCEKLFVCARAMRAEAKMVHRHLRCIIKQCGAEEGSFRAKCAGSAALKDLLVLLFGETELPRHPADAVVRYEPTVHDAEQANARHCIVVEVFAGVAVLDEGCAGAAASDASAMAGLCGGSEISSSSHMCW